VQDPSCATLLTGHVSPYLDPPQPLRLPLPLLPLQLLPLLLLATAAAASSSHCYPLIATARSPVSSNLPSRLLLRVWARSPSYTCRGRSF
jgi:hypothetical protein